MAITQCSECGGKVSNRLDSCPHCGAPNLQHQQVSPVAGGPILSDTEATAARDGLDHYRAEPEATAWGGVVGVVFVLVGALGAFLLVSDCDFDQECRRCQKGLDNFQSQVTADYRRAGVNEHNRGQVPRSSYAACINK